MGKVLPMSGQLISLTIKTQPELATPKRDELANLIRISWNLSGRARKQESKQAQLDSEGKSTE